MKFIATLNTLRPLNRPVQFHGSTQSSICAFTEKWLDCNGYAGDSFSIAEVVTVEVAVIECKNPPLVKQFRHHSPEMKPGCLRCDKCNRLYEEHA